MGERKVDDWMEEGEVEKGMEQKYGKVGEISDEAIDKATSDPADRAEIRAARDAIKKSTDKAKAIKEFAGKLSKMSAGVKKAFETAAKLAAVLMLTFFLAGPVFADTSDGFDTTMPNITIVEKVSIMPTIAGLDLNGVFSKTRAGVFVGFNGDHYASVCAPLISVLGPTSRREYFNLNLGGAKDTGGGDVNFLISFGWRIDSYFVKFSESKFAQKFLLFAYLPSIEAGPGVTWIPTKNKEIIFGVNIVTKFGGK